MLIARLHWRPQVSAPFRIEVAPDMLVKDQAFSCPTAHGIVPPGEKKFVSVFFRPETLDVRTMDYLSIVPSGCASQTLLKVVGFSTTRVSWSPLSGLKGVQPPLPFGERTGDCSPGHAGKEVRGGDPTPQAAVGSGRG